MPSRSQHNRWYCPKHPNVQVFPGTMFETLTVAPVEGKRRKAILLHTANAKFAEAGTDQRYAWCFIDKEFVLAFPRTMDDIYWLYAKRVGVHFATETRSKSGTSRTLLRILKRRRTA